jgi:hypothetical protein
LWIATGLFYVIGNWHFLLHKKRSAMDAHSRERKMSLRDRARRESFASETLCSTIENWHFLLHKKRSVIDAHSRERKMSLRDRARRESFASETLCSVM